jgi:hypothetical protein
MIPIGMNESMGDKSHPFTIVFYGIRMKQQPRFYLIFIKTLPGNKTNNDYQ